VAQHAGVCKTKFRSIFKRRVTQRRVHTVSFASSMRTRATIER
jgi:hypothetical protein